MNAPEPGSAEWSRIVTASKMAAIIGVSPWESPYSCWMGMKGRIEREPATKAQSRGHYLEPAILAWWRDQHDGEHQIAYRTQAWFPHEDWAGATVDAALNLWDGKGVQDTPVIVEAKSAAYMDEWGRPGTDEIPAYYLTQVYFQLAVSGAERCYVPVIGPYLDFSEYVVERDDEIQADLMARAKRFYDSLAADEPPELDGSEATYNIVRKAHPDIDAKATVQLTAQDAHEFIASIGALDAAESRARLAKATVLEVMGRANYADYNGVRVARRQPNKYGVSLVPVAKTTAALTPTEGTAA